MITTDQLYELFKKSRGVSTDSRSGLEGKIFVALKGDRFDGNDYARDALASGALAALVDRKDLEGENDCFYVPNALTALQRLAHFHRRQFNIPVIGITGTNGKTTTKELISAVLAQKFSLISTQGNLNNHIGVPLTLLRITGETQVAVIEMGANHPGEIDWLCRIAEPTLGLVTNVGEAHLEGFGSVETIWDTKMALYRYVDSHSGMVFINQNEPSLAPLKEVKFRNPFFFDQDNLPYPLKRADLTERGSVIFINLIDGEDHSWSAPVKLYGSHNKHNIMAAICFGAHLGVTPADMVAALTAYEAKINRSQVLQYNSNTIYLDAYNANPTSMIHALRFISDLQEKSKMVILGSMKELGGSSTAAHQQIVKTLSSMHYLVGIILVGEEYKEAIPAYSGSAPLLYFDQAKEVKDYLQSTSFSQCHILVKGSRSVGLERIFN